VQFAVAVLAQVQWVKQSAATLLQESISLTTVPMVIRLHQALLMMLTYLTNGIAQSVAYRLEKIQRIRQYNLKQNRTKLI
jgi:hypothetical protein